MQILMLWLDSYHWFFLLPIIGFPCLIFLQHKIREEHTIVIILHTGWNFWTTGKLEGQADFWEWDWLTVEIWRVILWLSFYGMVPILYLNDNYSLSFGVYGNYIKDFSSESAPSLLSWSLTIRGEYLLERITTKQSKCYI